MDERYWEPGYMSFDGVIKDFVSENVIEALTRLIAEGGAWIDVSEGKLAVTFHSFEMPEKDGEPLGVWHKSFDLLEMVTDWATDYAGPQKLSDDQREDLEERVRLLDQLAIEFRARVGL